MGAWIEWAFIAAYSSDDREGTYNLDHGKRWINTNAFFARLHALNGNGFLATYCTWTMRDAFLSTPTTHYAAMDCHVSSASQWILCSGQNILQHILHPPPQDEKDHMLPKPQPWTLDVWRRWKAGFAAAGEEENLKQETRRLAKKSAALMETLEAVLVPEGEADGVEVPGTGLETNDS
ncbi:hypothetical protein SLS62_003224 [Diatrype stigma]|uniref:Uncharacterized protein n=1 Tax=Diatrype stigma TaxID=117547 RepID=A0AAN9YUZ1_9PEZI